MRVIHGVLERLARGELDGFRRGDCDRLARRRITARALSACARGKRAEAHQLNRLATRDGRRHDLKDGVNGFARAGLAFARAGSDGVDEFLLVLIKSFLGLNPRVARDERIP